jgi:hypothetical protein
MIELATPAQLPEAVEEFAMWVGGDAWKMGALQQTGSQKILGTTDGTVSVVRFASAREFDGEGRIQETMYALSEARRVPIPRLPEAALQMCGIDESDVDSPDNSFTVTTHRNMDLHIPPVIQGTEVRQQLLGVIHMTAEQVYSANGHELCTCTVIGGEPVFRELSDDDVDEWVYESTYGLSVVEYFLAGNVPPQEPVADDLEALFHGDGPDGRVSRCASQMLAWMDALYGERRT